MTTRFKFYISILIVIHLSINNLHIYAQVSEPDYQTNPITQEINRTRLTYTILGASSVYVGSMGGLYYAWYRDKPMSSFHLHNDARQWLQMDKGGHIVSSYYIGKLGYEALRFSGVDEKRSTWFGGFTGSVFLFTVEIFDGFSPEYGASISDFLANLLGSSIFISQQAAWHEQRILLKYSYHNTKYAAYRPEVLGSNLAEKMIKDYNGISYWLSINPNSFGWKQAPKWLNIALGYSADGMTGALGNINNDKLGNPIPDFNRRRQFLLSLDIDLTRIKTRSSAINSVFELLGFIKIPFPTLEFDSNKNFKFHPLYF